MKRLFLLLALVAGPAAHAQLLVSAFSNFTVGAFSQAFDGPWTPATAQAGVTDFTVGTFGGDIPSGQAGNAFVQWIPVVQDWSAYTTVALTGTVLASNATPVLSFYLEDALGNSSLTNFNLADFGSSAGTRTAALNFGGVDATQISFWGFATRDAAAPVFGFTFDNVSLSSPGGPSAVPEPSTYGAFAAAGLLAVVGFRRRGRSAH